MNWNRDALRDYTQYPTKRGAECMPWIDVVEKAFLYVTLPAWHVLRCDGAGRVNRGCYDTPSMTQDGTNHYLPKEGEG